MARNLLTGISPGTNLSRIPCSPGAVCDIRFVQYLILDEKGSGIVGTTHFVSKTQLEIVLVRDELNLTGLCFLLSISPLCLSLLLLMIPDRSTCAMRADERIEPLLE